MNSIMVTQGFDISNPSGIKQWALFTFNGTTRKITIGDKFIDQYWGDIEVAGFSNNHYMIEVVRPPCDRYDAQPILHLYYDEFFERSVKNILNIF